MEKEKFEEGGMYGKFMKHKKMFKIGFVFLIILSLYFLSLFVSEIKSYGFIGAGIAPTNVISFTGDGEVYASPDIANISFTVTNDAKTSSEAQKVVVDKVNQALKLLKDSKVDDKDVKTENYSLYPKYNFDYINCAGINCGNQKRVIVGYEVSQMVSVTIRNIDNVGSIMGGLSDLGVTQMSGPDFAIDKEDALKEQARKLAIDSAKEKAKSLAKDLGVTLVRIVNFSENGNYPMPVYKMADTAVMSAGSAPAVPSIPTGENKISSTVIITYEIK